MSSKVVDLSTRRKSIPAPEKGKVLPRRVKNSERRPREHLFPDEVEKLIQAEERRIQLLRHLQL